MNAVINLPQRLPEGWEHSSMFTDAYIRKVSTRPGLRPEDAVPEIHGWDAIVLLIVEEAPSGVGYRATVGHTCAGERASLAGAAALAERTYCGCRVRAPVSAGTVVTLEPR
jgi:hypothetical protein